MIKVTATNQRTVRECMAPFELLNDNGDLEHTEIRVRYYSQTVGELKKLREEALRKFNAVSKPGTKINEKDFPWISNTLAKRIESLPDCAGDDGKPLKITVENLDLMSSINLRAIEKAIEDDAVPKPQPLS